MPRSQTRPDRAAEPAPSPPAKTAPEGGAPFPRLLPWLLLIDGLIGTLAAFVLTVEKLALLADSAYVTSCSLNPVLNCGSIMRTKQAEVFGFPNPLIGVAAFPIVAATGAALLAGARLRSWYWLGLQVGTTLGAGFVAWLIFQSLYRINALCPYCMVVWVVAIPVSGTSPSPTCLESMSGLGLARSSSRNCSLVTTASCSHSLPSPYWSRNGSGTTGAPLSADIPAHGRKWTPSRSRAAEAPTHTSRSHL